jgi:hypothetical protein
MKGLTISLIVLGGLFPLGAFAKTPGGGATPAKGIDVMTAYAGVWKVEMDHLAVDGGKAGHESTTLHNACWKSGTYFACNQYVNGESKILLVFTFNEKENVYTSYQIPEGGGEAGTGKLKIDGNVWTFPWELTDAGKTTYYRVVNDWVAADRIEFRQEHSTDQAHWTVTAKGVETKTGAE